MNPNVERINEYTVGVNFGLVTAGLVSGITLKDKKGTSDKDIVSISSDGLIVLNKQNDFYNFGALMFPIIQLDNDAEFKRKMGYVKRKLKSNTASVYERIYAMFLDWEAKRRNQMQEGERK